jgi:Flp pilus assembly protein TadD
MNGREVYMKKVLLCAVLAAMTGVAAFAQSGAGNAGQDRADFTEALRLDPDDAMTYFIRGVVYAGKGDLDQARADFTESLRLAPNNVYVRNNLERLWGIEGGGCEGRAIASRLTLRLR